MGVKVSVVVPAHNLGPCLDACLDSLRAQTLSAGEYEVLFVDDGSNDGTCERLRTLAEHHAHIRVIHAAGTGGPGRPRNIGIEVAAGEYLMFLDPDDRLTPHALERMYAMAIQDSADVLIGKVVGHGGQKVPPQLFRESRHAADLVQDEVFRLATPHQLFRTGFLLRHRLRFAEAPTPLDDDRFVVSAYFHAKIISVLADEVCCHVVGQNSHRHYPAARFDAMAHYQGLLRLLDVVDQHTRPGEERDRIHAYWFATAMLGVLDERGDRAGAGRPVRSMRALGPLRPQRAIRSLKPLRSLAAPVRSLATPARSLTPVRPDGTGGASHPLRASMRSGRQPLYQGARQLAQERFSPGVERWLPLSMRVRARLLDAGAYGDIARLAAAERGLTAVATLESVDWDEAVLVVRVGARLAYADGRPVSFRRDDGRLLWEPPVSLRTKVPSSAYDVTTVIADSRLDVCLRNRDDSGDFRLPTQCTLEAEAYGRTEQLVMHATARLDVRTAKLGRPLDAGTWGCFVRIESCGWEIERRLARPSLYQATPPAASRTIGSTAGFLVEPRWTTAGNLSVVLTST